MFAAAAALASLALSGRTASASSDTIGPTFTMQPFSHLVYPTTVMGGSSPFSQAEYSTQAVQKWSASDPSGICEYQLYTDEGRAVPQLVYQGLKTSYTFSLTDAGDAGYDWTGFDLRVKDCVGNWSSHGPQQWPHDRYIDSYSTHNSAVTYDNAAAKYAGTWATAKCSCFVDGTTSSSSTKGASPPSPTAATSSGG